MTVRFTDEAGAQLSDILTWLNRRNPRSAARFSQRLNALVEQLKQSPYAGQRRLGPEIRALPVRSYPYVVFYCVEANEVVILSIRHGARRPPSPSDLT